MKNRWILAFSVLISVFLLSIAAAAAETYPSIADLYQLVVDLINVQSILLKSKTTDLISL